MTIGLVAPSAAASISSTGARQRRRAAGRGRSSTAVDVVGRRARRARRRRSRRASTASRAAPAGRPAPARRCVSAARLSVSGLRALAITATRGPRITGCVARTRAVSSMAATVGTSISPACWYSAPPVGPIAAAPAWTATIGRCPRHPPGDAGELARVAERLGVHGDDPGRLVVLPELQQVVARHVATCRRATRTTTAPCRARRPAAARTPPSDPDCSEIATLPGGRLTGTSDACRPIDGRDAATPTLPGPIRRTPARRARATSVVDVDVGALDAGDDDGTADVRLDAVLDDRRRGARPARR